MAKCKKCGNFNEYQDYDFICWGCGGGNKSNPIKPIHNCTNKPWECNELAIEAWAFVANPIELIFMCKLCVEQSVFSLGTDQKQFIRAKL